MTPDFTYVIFDIYQLGRQSEAGPSSFSTSPGCRAERAEPGTIVAPKMTVFVNFIAIWALQQISNTTTTNCSAQNAIIRQFHFYSGATKYYLGFYPRARAAREPTYAGSCSARAKDSQLVLGSRSYELAFAQLVRARAEHELTILSAS